jgi:hypothetical protein
MFRDALRHGCWGLRGLYAEAAKVRREVRGHDAGEWKRIATDFDVAAAALADGAGVETAIIPLVEMLRVETRRNKSISTAMEIVSSPFGTLPQHLSFLDEIRFAGRHRFNTDSVPDVADLLTAAAACAYRLGAFDLSYGLIDPQTSRPMDSLIYPLAYVIEEIAEGSLRITAPSEFELLAAPLRPLILAGFGLTPLTACALRQTEEPSEWLRLCAAIDNTALCEPRYETAFRHLERARAQA